MTDRRISIPTAVIVRIKALALKQPRPKADEVVAIIAEEFGVSVSGTHVTNIWRGKARKNV